MCYELDHFGKNVVSMQWLKIRFGTIGYLTTEIYVILEVHPLDFSAIFPFISSVFIKIYEYSW